MLQHLFDGAFFCISFLFTHIVGYPSVELHRLRRAVGHVAGEQEPVSRVDHVGEAHEHQAINGQRCGHPDTDDISWFVIAVGDDA